MQIPMRRSEPGDSKATRAVEGIAQTLRDWRSTILNAILRGVCILGAIAVVVSIISAFDERPDQAPLLAGLYIGVYAVLALAAFAPWLGFTVRALLLHAILYGLALLGLVQSGLSGDGRTFLFALVAVAAVLLGLRAALVALGVSLLTLLAVGGLIVGGQIVVPVEIQANSNDPISWASGAVIFLLLISMLIIPMTYLLSRLTATLAAAEKSAQRATESAALTSEQATRLAHQAANLAATERALRDLVSTLETPVVALQNGAYLAPLVGMLDQQRAEAIMGRLLETAATSRVQLMIIDVAGVAASDAHVATTLVNAAQALRLIGCGVTVTGISATTALFFTQHDISLGDIAVAQSPQQALEHYQTLRLAR